MWELFTKQGAREVAVVKVGRGAAYNVTPGAAFSFLNLFAIGAKSNEYIPKSIVFGFTQQ
jgi:hypothetical protein